VGQAGACAAIEPAGKMPPSTAVTVVPVSTTCAVFDSVSASVLLDEEGLHIFGADFAAKSSICAAHF